MLFFMENDDQEGADMAPLLEWTAENGLLTRHEKTSFGRNDSISVPAGKAAVLSRDGEYSDVYREGDRPALGSGLLPKSGTLYMIDMKPTKAISWGFGGVPCGKRICGINGTLRLQVVSPRKFLTAYAAQELPLTADSLAALWIQRLGEAVRSEALRLGRAGIGAAELPAQIAKATADQLSEELEEKGLSLYELNIEPLFFPDNEDDDE